MSPLNSQHKIISGIGHKIKTNDSFLIYCVSNTFFQGLYFADCPSKSANYCHATNSAPDGLLLLCKVALGSSKILYDADDSLPKTLGKENHSITGSVFEYT